MASHLPTTHNHNTHAPKKNTNTMISPARRLPAASILQVSGIAVQPTIAHDLRNTAMQYFFMWNQLILYFIYYYSMCSGLARLRTKGESLEWLLALFLWPLRWNDAHWLQLCRYLFHRCRPSIHLVLAWFWMSGRGGAMIAFLFTA